MRDQTFLGIGWRYPLDLERNQDGQFQIATAKYVESIEESIRIILGTTKGERVMRPDFGSNLYHLVFSPNNTSTAGFAMYYVREALIEWEPRIEVLNVEANPDEQNPNTLLIEIQYRVIKSNTEYNLVYPFYLGTQG